MLIGDEPVSAVDETQAEALLRQARDRFGTAVLALHDVALARSYATRLVGLNRNRIVFDAPAEPSLDMFALDTPEMTTAALAQGGDIFTF